MGRSPDVTLGSNREPTKWQSWRHSYTNRFTRVRHELQYIIFTIGMQDLCSARPHDDASKQNVVDVVEIIMML